MVFFMIAAMLPVLAALLPDYTRTLAKAPEIISRAYIDRVANFAVSGKRADMVVAGSSLVIFPHILTDGYYEKVPVPVPDPIEYADFLSKYVDMAHFKTLLSATLSSGTAKNQPSAFTDSFMSHKASVVDLGVPSLMLSDCDQLFRKLEQNDAMPGHVVLLLAPRDFMDNTVAAERNLFAYEMKGRVTQKELAKSKDAASFFAAAGSALNYCANAWGKQFRSSGQRVLLAVKKLGREPRKEIAAGGPTQEQALHHFYFGDGKLSDLGVYKKRYTPADHARIKEQLAALGILLDRLKAHNVHTTVVSMPLTPENIALIDKDARAEIVSGMSAACRSREIQFIPAEEMGTYPNEQVVDSVHLNAKGGHEFFLTLARRLSL